MNASARRTGLEVEANDEQLRPPAAQGKDVTYTPGLCDDHALKLDRSVDGMTALFEANREVEAHTGGVIAQIAKLWPPESDLTTPLLPERR